ncbi:Gfo/Idh/MocA family oxidoreductase [Dactylosporangium sp. NPDC005572]|uniref:Gfo/Idh/MocA family protein n=1 Tax=Dactylosporangium sp. NPDC005572 TaxID=3156889 RepID=UPI0033BFA3E9
MIGVAVLGSGAIAADHVSAFARVGGVEVTHVVGTDLARARRIAALAPGCRAGTDLGDALADPAVTGVIVCGRTGDHPARALAAIAAGKHVVIEKPPARRLADFDAVVAAARTAGVRVMVGQTTRFQPAVRTLAAAAAAGEVGTPRLLHLAWYVGHVWPGGWNSWQLDPAASGGHLVHNGMHPLDLAIALLGDRPERVFTRGWCTHAPGMPTPDSFHVTVRFAGGAVALAELSYGLRRPGDMLRRMTLTGETGTLAHHTAADAALGGTPVTTPPASVADALYHQAVHTADVFAGRAAPLITLEQSRAALATALAAQRSLEAGAPMEVTLDA